MLYLDTCYLVRLYLEDPGFEAVRALAAVDSLACAAHGRAEILAAFHRKLRERGVTPAAYRALLEQFDLDCAEQAFQWLPLAPAVLDRVRRVFDDLPAKAFLRAGDALHLACAAENGFERIHSNDQRLLDSASHFGLRGIDVIEH